MAKDADGPTTKLGDSTFVGFVPVRNLAVSKGFYVGTLGLALTDESPFAVVIDAGGTTIRLTEVPDLIPQSFTIAGWEVSNISEMVKSLKLSGVAFRCYEGMDQDDLGVWTTPSGDAIAWFVDPDGNTLSLTMLA